MKRPLIDKETLVKDHRRLVYHLIYRTVFEKEAYEELFQEVFLQIFRGIGSFRGKSKISTWVASVTLNTCLTYLRKRSGCCTLSLDQWLEHSPETPVEAPSPQSQLESEERGKMIETQLDRLPHKYKLPLVLFYFEGYTYREIGEILKWPMGTVKSNLYRGLGVLRERLGGGINEFL